MNQDQRKYLLKRLDDVTATKRREIYASLPSVDIIPFLKKLKPIVFDVNKKASELLTKLVKEETLPCPNNYQTFISFNESELFSNYDAIKESYNQAIKDNKSIGRKKETQLDSYVTGLKDEIMLGDSKKALEQLAQFEKMKF